MTCSLVTPDGSWALIAPSKMRFVASPRIFGPRIANVTLITASTITRRTSGASGRRPPSSRRSEPPKSRALAGGRPMPMPIIIPPRGPPPGRLGPLRVDVLLVRLVGLEQLSVRADADDPTAVEDDDPVGPHDRRDPLSDD